MRAQNSTLAWNNFLLTFLEENPSPEEVASALRIPESALALEVGPIQSVSTARAKLMIPVRDWMTLDEMEPDFEQIWKLCDQYHTTGFYPFTIQTKRAETHAEARQFPKRAGYNEDPATGIAACALGAYLTAHEVFSHQTPDWHTYRIEQGHAMGRPSVIFAEALVKEGQIVKTRLGGTAWITAEEMIPIEPSGKASKIK